MVCLAITGLAAEAHASGTPTTYKAFKYPRSVESPTYDMAQAKLWHHDGAWWAALSSPAKDGVHLYELAADHTWRDTGAIVDPRPTGRADVLWDGDKLYVVTATHSAEVSLARLSYDKAARTYRVDAGFPVAIARGGALTASIAKDSSGTLWAVLIQEAKVLVTRTDGDDARWIPPFEPPGPKAHPTKAHDAMASIVAFNGVVGIMWTNPNPGTFRFATHQDGAPDDAWSKVEDALSRVGSNDHISLRAVPGDPQGRLYAAVKTSRRTPRDPPDDPGIMLLVRDRKGAWSRYPVSPVSEDQTRPQLLLDPGGRRVYVFSSTYRHHDTIFYKSASMDAPSFEAGAGSPFLHVRGARLNNITTTKQSVDATTGIVAMSAANVNRTYYHVELPIRSDAPQRREASMASYQDQEGTYPAAGSTELHLAIYRGEQADPGSLDRKATLTCDPDGGTHPKPAKACDALREVDGDIDKLPGDPGPCTREFNPLTATAEGTFQGRPVAFQRTYGNPCELTRALTPVFDF